MALTKASLKEKAYKAKAFDVQSLEDQVFAKPAPAPDIFAFFDTIAEFEKQRAEGSVPVDVRLGLIAKSICDEAGELLFDNQDDASQLPHAVLDELFQICREVNRLGIEKGAIEESVKNSETPQDASSTV